MITQETPAQEAVKREMYRLSQDDCMVNNPTDEDFYIEWEEFKHLVPNRNKDIGWGNGKREVKRYLANWYCKHMKDKLINEMGDKQAEILIQKRADAGKEEFTDLYVKNNEIYSKVPRTDDPKLMAQLYPNLFLGVVREYGLDYTATDGEMLKYDDRSQEEKVMDQLSKIKYQAAQPEPTTTKIIETHHPEKAKLAKEVTA